MVYALKLIENISGDTVISWFVNFTNIFELLFCQLHSSKDNLLLSILTQIKIK